MQTEPENIDNYDPIEIKRLVGQLRHYDKSKRTDAAQRLKHIGMPAFHELWKMFDQEWSLYLHHCIYKKRRRKRLVCAGVGISILGGMLVFCEVAHPLGPLLISVGLTLLFFDFFMNPHNERMPTRLATVYDLLINTDNPYMLGAGLEMYRADTVWITDEILEFMTKSLHDLPQEVWEYIAPNQREALYLLLDQKAKKRSDKCQSFVLAGLSALEQFGDREAIPTVQSIAKHGSNKAVVQAAYDCLEYLEVRRDEETIRTTLLRASQSEAGKDELLRIPTHAPNTESEQLLRMPGEAE